MTWLKPGRLPHGHSFQGWLFLVPLMVTTIVVIVLPTLATVAFSLTDWSGFGEVTFIGLENFRQLATDASFLQSLKHAVIWTAIFLTVPIFMGLLGAVLLSEAGRLQTFFKLVYFIPVTLASVINAHIWRSLYDPFRGVGAVLDGLGIPFLAKVAFLGEKNLALHAVAWVDVWRWWGFLVVVFLAAMQAINPELYDSAKVDGASWWLEIRHVTLPGIRVTLLFVVLITIVGSLNVFDYVYILTQGGPAGATEVPVTLLYKSAFQKYEAGYAAATRNNHVLPQRAGPGWVSAASAHGMGRMTADVTVGTVTRRWNLRRALLVYVPLVILAIVAVGPVLVLLFNSLKTGREIVQDPLGLPDAPQLANYARAWRQGRFESTMRNSAILTAGSVTGVCIISGLAAYALGRLRVRGSRGVVTYLFLATTAPAPLYVIPLFFMWTRLGQINSLSGLIIIYWGVLSPFGTLLLRSFLLSLPPELEDAGRVDGASEIRVLLSIILPLSWPGFVVVGLITALGTWNEFFFANTFIHSQRLKPVTISLLSFQHQFSNDWELTSAASVIAVGPVVALFLVFQRRFIAGMTAGGLRG